MFPLPNLTPYLLISNLLVVGCWAFDHQYQKNAYLELKNSEQSASIDSLTKSLKTAKEWQDTIEVAQNAATERDKQLQSALTVVADSNNGLRNTIVKLQRDLPSATAETNRSYADTLAIVFGECTERYAAMGRNAQERANEATTLNEAWPK